MANRRRTSEDFWGRVNKDPRSERSGWRRSFWRALVKRSTLYHDYAGFWRRVDEHGCWLWLGPYDKDGYGRARLYGCPTPRAHQIAFILSGRERQKHDCTCHTCDVPCCVNPTHLFKSDQRGNMADRDEKHRQAVGPRNHFTRMDVRGTKNARAVLSERDVVAILKRKGESRSGLAREYGVTTSCIRGIVTGKLWPHLRPELQRAKTRPRSKLTAEQAADIRSSTARHSDLARRYGVSIGCIRFVRLGKTWRPT